MTRQTGTDDKDSSESHVCTTEQAVRLVRSSRSGTQFNVRIRLDAPVEGDPEHVYPDDLTGYVRVSKAVALDLATTLLSPGLEAKGGRIPITISQYKILDKWSCTLWIG